MFEKLVTRSGPKFTLTMLPGAGLLAAASVFALGLVFTVATPQPASAFECALSGVGAVGSDGTEASNTACGTGSLATGAGGATAIGNNAAALANQSTVVGANAGVAAGADGGIAIGRVANIVGGDSDRGIALGDNARVGVGGAFGAPGPDNIAIGTTARAGDVATIAIGKNAVSNNDGSIAIGANSGGFNGGSTEQMGGHAISIGIRSRATGGDGVAMGHFAKAQSFASTALGSFASVEADFGTALGRDASVLSGHTNSTAVGAGATTSRANQVMLGTLNESYTLPGLPGDPSRSFQSGPLELVTTDADGNLASGGGRIFDDIEDNTEGIAMAMALENPDLKGSEKFGIAFNAGYFEGEYAVAGAIMASLVEGNGVRLAVAGGAAYGVERENIGARAGFQLTW